LGTWFKPDTGVAIIRDWNNGMTNVVALSLIADLLFSVQVEEAANRLGFRVSTVSTPDNAISALRQGRASLLVIDLTAAGHRAAEVVRAARAAPYPVAVLAFGPHVDRKMHQAAQDAGADLVVSRNRFSRELSQLMMTCLDRHRESASKEGGDE
jgi:DNA-binding response OmpR family regulator